MGNLNPFILQFVNSKDIREYLRTIDYQFNALEAAWLIWQSCNTTVDERHQAWKKVILEFPDCAIEERMNTRQQPSLHGFLREYMEMVKDMCQRYVREFPEQKGSLLFTGKTGLGKTFLSNCIARELIEQCFSVVYLSAAEMFDIFSKERFSREEDEDHTRSEYLTECDLLIIDDLGTELVNTFTVSQLFYLVNDRLIAKKGTIISTNLPTNQMRDEFTDRVMSRIISGYQIIPLYGEDIRVRRKLLGIGG